MIPSFPSFSVEGSWNNEEWPVMGIVCAIELQFSYIGESYIELHLWFSKNNELHCKQTSLPMSHIGCALHWAEPSCSRQRAPPSHKVVSGGPGLFLDTKEKASPFRRCIVWSGKVPGIIFSEYISHFVLTTKRLQIILGLSHFSKSKEKMAGILWSRNSLNRPAIDGLSQPSMKWEKRGVLKRKTSWRPSKMHLCQFSKF